MATPEPPSQQPDTPPAQQQPTPEPQAAPPPIAQQLSPQPPADAVPTGPPTPAGTPTQQDAPTPQHIRPQLTPAQPGVPIASPGATPPAGTAPGAVPAAGAPPFGVPASPYPPQPGMPAATASQPLWPVPPQQFAPVTGQQPVLSPGGPVASYPALQPVGQPQRPYPGPPPATRRPANPIPGRQLFGGIALIVAAGLAAGGSIPNLDHAVERTLISDNTLGGVLATVNTSPWYFHSDVTNHPDQAEHLTQYFGVGLVLGALLALVTGVLLVVGLGRRAGRLPGWGAVAGAVLVGAVVTTLMSAVNDMQFDNYVPSGEHFVAGEHVTTFGLGFWLLLGAGVVAVVAMVLLLMRERRAEPPTPRFGIPVQQAPVSAPQASGYPAQQFPGPQHG